MKKKKKHPREMIFKIIDLICKCYTPEEHKFLNVFDFSLEDNLKVEYGQHTDRFTEDFEITASLMKLISDTAKETKVMFKENRHPADVSERIVQAFKVVFYEVYKMKKEKLNAEKEKKVK